MRNDIICFIPARKKSSLKNKNMIKIDNKPLIYYTLNSAKNSKYIKDNYVSSDSLEIQNYSKKFNVKVLKRPKKLALSSCKGYEVISHFVKKNISLLKNKSLLILQPTSPLRKTSHIDKAINLHYQNRHRPIISVKKIDNKFLKGLIFRKKSLIPLENGRFVQENRQSLPKIFLPNGAIFLFSIKDFKKNNKIPFKKSLPMFMSEKESIDLDTKKDLIKIKRILTKNEKKF